ncbi:SOS-response transcriptional repressor LexA [Acinetobacter baylyi]|uniref:SOS-response transcriptional repressor LexA n=1 Tax=Acinetobacter baylyi TaxID=202950 RepID=A0ABU0V1A7_ACIBI|nr:S24 family peptidase [Acinetobacter baylyi]MDQ1210582.1 SOS-response transcriptional repressor LexA [Acinetobacter baylyi]MDR6105824.1 SOS-response transcriptional repressor LexA [Acinetobacter baylyi]MDR6187457.1 SOS-response transcriptional repressor LexA [Acinetobacter baylyi]
MTIKTDRIKEEFAKRLHDAMDKKGYPVRGRARVLSKEFYISDKGAGKWLNGDAIPETSKIPLIAKFLKVNSEWLLSGSGDMDISNNIKNIMDNNIDLKEKLQFYGKLIPVISWVAAGSWTSIDSIPVGTQFDEWLPPNPKCGKNGYGLVVKGESMSPKFEPNDRIYINPDFQVSDLKTGDLVIVSCEGEKEATFKKLVIETDGMYLEPLNPKWHEKIIELHEGCKLIGKVVGLYREV